MIDLKTLVGGAYPVVPNNDGRPRHHKIPCRHGHIAVHSDSELYAYATGEEPSGRLAKVAGVRVIQDARPGEIRVAFKPDRLPAVIKVMEIRPRPQHTPEQLAALRERAAKARSQRHPVRQSLTPAGAV